MCKQCPLSLNMSHFPLDQYICSISYRLILMKKQACETHSEKLIEAECQVFYWNKHCDKMIAQFNHRQRVCAWVAVCKKCIMFVIICPLFVGKLRALTYEINPNEQAVSRIYGGRIHRDISSLPALIISPLYTR